MRLIEFPDTIDLAFDKTELRKDGRDEPVLPAAVVADFIEATRLDPTRVGLNPETNAPKPSVWRGPTGSLLLHLLPMLALISWLRPPLDLPAPIPVQLVIEQPPPPLPAKPPPQPSPPPGPRASDDFGTVGPPSAQNGSDTVPPTQGKSPPPTPTQTAPTPPVESSQAMPEAAPPVPAPSTQGEMPSPVTEAQTPPTPPVPPVESSQAAAAPPVPAAPSTQGELPAPVTEAMTPQPPPEPPVAPFQAAPRMARSAPAKLTPPKQQMAARPPILEGLELPLPLHPDPHQASASARYPGPNASRDEYCAYALHLTMEHLDLLPLSLLGARHGDTTVTIRLREDGTVIYARVVQGSGYLDVDERIADMVRAVRQFPPFPLWLRGPTSDFTLHMHFPNPLQR
jgi:TonB family protein